MENEKENLHERIKTVQEKHNQLTNSKWEAIRDVQGEEAVSLMLFSNEVQRIQDLLYQLRDRQLFKIPEQISKLNTQIKDLNTQIRNTREKKELAQQELQQLRPERKEKIDEIQGKIRTKNSEKENLQSAIEQLRPERKEKVDEIQGKIKSQHQKKKRLQTSIEDLKNRLNNMITTAVISQPSFSDTPVSSKLKLNLGLGFVLGVFLGIFLAFLLEFWENNKDKISQKKQ